MYKRVQPLYVKKQGLPQIDSGGEVESRSHQAAAVMRATKGATFVGEQGMPFIHAVIRSTVIPVAVATCCKWVRVSPIERERLSPQQRTAWACVPSIPAR